MDIKSFFSKDTRRGRTVRTFLQAFVGVLGFVISILTIPNFSDVLESAGVVVQTGTIATYVAIATYIYNAVESLIKYLWD